MLVFLTARGVRHHRTLSLAVEQREAQLRKLHGTEELVALTRRLVNLIARLDQSEPLPVKTPART